MHRHDKVKISEGFSLLGGWKSLATVQSLVHRRSAKGHAATRCAAMDEIRAKKTVLVFREEQG